MKLIRTLLAAFFLTQQVWFAELNAAARFNAEALDGEIIENAELLRLPGLSLAVVHDGAIIHRLNVGFADLESKKPIADDSIFWLASITKSFSAVMLMQYESDGRLSLNDPLIRYPFASVGFFPQRVRADVRLKHAISHTSEAIPGTTFVYHGGRYNFVYGVFQQMSGLKFPDAYHHELSTRITQPLGLEATLPGFPSTNSVSLRARIVMPYGFDSSKQAFTVNRDAQNPGAAYPASGLLSSIKDLAAYTTALDEERLLKKDAYTKMTTPFVNNRGEDMPYGMGWFTQTFAGVPLHWAYGLGDSDSAILLRVPTRRLSLIVLCNSSFATAPSRLGGGNALNSPFVVAFLKSFVFEKELDKDRINYGAKIADISTDLNRHLAKSSHPIYAEELLSQALTRTFAERTFTLSSAQGELLTELLYRTNPDTFKKYDPTVSYLLSQHTGSKLDEAAELAEKSYRAVGRFHPWIVHALAKRFEAKGQKDKALEYFHTLADTAGFEEQGETVDACAVLGKYYTEQKQFDKAREYLWRALVYKRQVGGNDSAILRQLEDVNSLDH